MRKLIIPLLLIILTFSNCREKEISTLEIVNRTKEMYEKHISISYEINYKNKYFSNDDTTEINASCKLIRETSDTLFGGIIWFNTADSTEKYYDLTNIYAFDHKQKNITEFRAHYNQTWAIKGNTAGSVFKIYFLNPEKLIEIINDTTNYVLLSDTISNNESLWIINVKYPDDHPFSNMEKEFWISKQNNHITKISFKAKFQNSFQYNEWNISNIEFDKYDQNFLQNKFKDKLDTYKIKQYVEENKEVEKPIKIGTIAPIFSGISYPDNTTIQLSDFKGKVILLDFWYMSCYPCIQAIPHLTSIHNKYKENGLVVLGLNPFDNKEKKRKKLPDFIEYNKLNYPIVFVNKEIPKKYNVRGYPTFYIINKKGEIAFSQVGFGENMVQKIDSIIQREIK